MTSINRRFTPVKSLSSVIGTGNAAIDAHIIARHASGRTYISSVASSDIVGDVNAVRICLMVSWRSISYFTEFPGGFLKVVALTFDCNINKITITNENIIIIGFG
jgi:hypothetical protein